MNCHFRAIFQSYYIIVNWRNASKQVKTEKRDQLICQRKQKEKREKKSNKTKKNRRIFYEKRHLSEIHISFFLWSLENWVK